MLIARLVLHCQQIIVVKWNGVDCSSDLYTKNLPRKDLRNIQEHKIHVHWLIVMLSQLESVRGSLTQDYKMWYMWTSSLGYGRGKAAILLDVVISTIWWDTWWMRIQELTLWQKI